MLFRPIRENSPLMAVVKATVKDTSSAQMHNLLHRFVHLQTVALHPFIKPFEPQLGDFVGVVQRLHPFVDGKAHRMQFARQLERISGFTRASAPTHKVYVVCECHCLIDKARMAYPRVHLGLRFIHQRCQRQTNFV